MKDLIYFYLVTLQLFFLVRPQTIHQCDLCGYASNRINNFKLHVKQVGRKEPYHFCVIDTIQQCCGSKYNTFRSGSRIVAQFGSGSRSRSRVMF